MVPLVPGARLELEGQCNRCGSCCVAEVDARRVVCEYLVAEFPVQPLGTPMASRCRAYEYRHPSRPLEIRMLDAQGTAKLTGRCFKDTWQEDHAIAERGIGKGCSLSLKIHEGQLVNFQASR